MSGTDVHGPAWYATQREADVVRRNRAKYPDTKADAESVVSQRYEILAQMGAWASGEAMADPAIMQQLERFETALFATWDELQRREVEARACAAVRRALEALADGKLL